MTSEPEIHLMVDYDVSTHIVGERLCGAPKGQGRDTIQNSNVTCPACQARRKPNKLLAKLEQVVKDLHQVECSGAVKDLLMSIHDQMQAEQAAELKAVARAVWPPPEEPEPKPVVTFHIMDEGQSMCSRFTESDSISFWQRSEVDFEKLQDPRTCAGCWFMFRVRKTGETIDTR